MSVQPELQAYLLNYQDNPDKSEYSDGLTSSEFDGFSSSTVNESESSNIVYEENLRKYDRKLTKQQKKKPKTSKRKITDGGPSSPKQKQINSTKSSSNKKRKTCGSKSKAKRQKSSSSMIQHNSIGELFCNESILKLLEYQESNKPCKYSSISTYSHTQSPKGTTKENVDSGIHLSDEWSQTCMFPSQDDELSGSDIDSDDESFTEDQLSLIETVLNHDGTGSDIDMLSGERLQTTKSEELYHGSVEQCIDRIKDHEVIVIESDCSSTPPRSTGNVSCHNMDILSSKRLKILKSEKLHHDSVKQCVDGIGNNEVILIDSDCSSSPPRSTGNVQTEEQNHQDDVISDSDTLFTPPETIEHNSDVVHDSNSSKHPTHSSSNEKLQTNQNERDESCLSSEIEIPSDFSNAIQSHTLTINDVEESIVSFDDQEHDNDSLTTKLENQQTTSPNSTDGRKVSLCNISTENTEKAFTNKIHSQDDQQSLNSSGSTTTSLSHTSTNNEHEEFSNHDSPYSPEYQKQTISNSTDNTTSLLTDTSTNNEQDKFSNNDRANTEDTLQSLETNTYALRDCDNTQYTNSPADKESASNKTYLYLSSQPTDIEYNDIDIQQEIEITQPPIDENIVPTIQIDNVSISLENKYKKKNRIPRNVKPSKTKKALARKSTGTRETNNTLDVDTSSVTEGTIACGLNHNTSTVNSIDDSPSKENHIPRNTRPPKTKKALARKSTGTKATNSTLDDDTLSVNEGAIACELNQNTSTVHTKDDSSSKENRKHCISRNSNPPSKTKKPLAIDSTQARETDNTLDNNTLSGSEGPDACELNHDILTVDSEDDSPSKADKIILTESPTITSADSTLENNSSLVTEAIITNKLTHSPSTVHSKDDSPSKADKVIVTDSLSLTSADSSLDTSSVTEGIIANKLTQTPSTVNSKTNNEASIPEQHIEGESSPTISAVNTLSVTEEQIQSKLTPTAVNPTVENPNELPLVSESTQSTSTNKDGHETPSTKTDLPFGFNINKFADKETSKNAIDYLMQMDEDDVDAVIDSMISNQFQSCNAFGSVLLSSVSTISLDADDNNRDKDDSDDNVTGDNDSDASYNNDDDDNALSDDSNDVTLQPEVDVCEVTIDSDSSEPLDKDCPFLPPERRLDDPSSEPNTDMPELTPKISKDKTKFVTSTPKIPVKKPLNQVKKDHVLSSNKPTQEKNVVMSEERKQCLLDKYINNVRTMKLTIPFLPIRSKKKTKFKVMPRNPTQNIHTKQSFANRQNVSNSLSPNLKDGHKVQKAKNGIPKHFTKANTGGLMEVKSHSSSRADNTEQDTTNGEIKQITNSNIQELHNVHSSKNKFTTAKMKATYSNRSIISHVKESSIVNCEPSECVGLNTYIESDPEVKTDENHTISTTSDHLTDQSTEHSENGVFEHLGGEFGGEDVEISSSDPVCKYNEDVSSNSTDQFVNKIIIDKELTREMCNDCMSKETGEVLSNSNENCVNKIMIDKEPSEKICKNVMSKETEGVSSNSDENCVNEMKTNKELSNDGLLKEMEETEQVLSNSNENCVNEMKTNKEPSNDGLLKEMEEIEQVLSNSNENCVNEMKTNKEPSNDGLLKEMEETEQVSSNSNENCVNEMKTNKEPSNDGLSKEMKETEEVFSHSNIHCVDMEVNNDNIGDMCNEVIPKGKGLFDETNDHTNSQCKLDVKVQNTEQTKMQDVYSNVNAKAKDQVEKSTSNANNQCKLYLNVNTEQTEDVYSNGIAKAKDQVEKSTNNPNNQCKLYIDVNTKHSEDVMPKSKDQVEEITNNIEPTSSEHFQDTSNNDIQTDEKPVEDEHSQKTLNSNSEQSTASKESNEVSVDSGINKDEGENFTFNEENSMQIAIKGDGDNTEQSTSTIDMQNSISANNNYGKTSKIKSKRTSRKRKLSKIKIPKENIHNESQEDEIAVRNNEEVVQPKRRKNENKLLHKYYKEKMKNLKKENEHLKNKSLMFDWISDLKEEIRHLKKSQETLQSKSDDQELHIHRQELLIHRLEERVSCSHNHGSTSVRSLNRQQFVNERQDATITSSDTDMR